MKVARIAVFALAATLLGSLHSRADSSQEKFWTQYIEACDPASQLNNHAHFLGMTNSVGPGSVWGIAGGTTNLLATADSYLGAPDTSGKFKSVQYATTEANCTDKGSRNWDFSLGVPVSIVQDAGSVDLSLALKNAKTITVAIKAIQIDSVPVAIWEDAATVNTSHSSSVYTDAVDGKHYLLNAAVAVTGLTITYTLDNSLSASLQASIQAGKAVNIGTQANPITAKVDVSNTGQTVTLTATDRTYVLGQFLKINKVAPKKQDPTFTPQPSQPPSTPNAQPKQPAPSSHIKVISDVAASAAAS
jgi:hypothetical protein